MHPISEGSNRRAESRLSDNRHWSSIVPDPVTVRHILLATDFSEFSARALDFALEIASRYGSQLYLFHCINPAPYGLVGRDVLWQTCDDARDELEELVSNLRRQGLAQNVDIKVRVSAGDVGSILPQAVKDLDLNLVIVGTHGRSGWQKAVLGSVAEILIDEASCPVLSVGPSAHRMRLQEFGPQNILLVSEASARSQLAESYAFSLACKYGARLTVIDVVENRSGRTLAEVLQLKCCDTAEPDRIPDTTPPNTAQLSPEVGTQSDLILQVADRSAADLIVMAAPKNHRFRDRFLSNSSYQVVCGSWCPVLTVHDRARSADKS